MKVALLLIILFAALTVTAQQQFRLNDASKIVDVGLEIGPCSMGDSGRCTPLTVKFYRKRAAKPFQIIRLPQTEMWDSSPKANVTLRYDDQSIINFEDFNFDGLEDIAICDGSNGGYGMPSYRIYLYSGSQKRFVYSRSFTRMNFGGLGMFETDKKKKIHYVFTKSGCCWHQTRGYDVHRGRPRLVYELTEAAWDPATPETVEITTGKLIKGRWRTWVKHAKVSEYYKKPN